MTRGRLVLLLSRNRMGASSSAGQAPRSARKTGREHLNQHRVPGEAVRAVSPQEAMAIESSKVAGQPASPCVIQVDGKVIGNVPS